MILDSRVEPELPLLRLPFGSPGEGAVLVAARGLWDRSTRPGGPEALLRAYQRTVPCRVALRADEDPEDAGLTPAELCGVIDRCLRYSRPRIAVPLLIEASSASSAAGFLELAGALLTERLPGCKLVLRWPAASRRNLFPIVEAIGAVLETDSRDDASVWAWRIPIEAVLDEKPEAPLERSLEALRATRLVIDSVDVLTTIDAARAWTPAREQGLLGRIVSERPAIDIWRVSDLLQAEFLAHSAMFPLA